MPGTHKKSPARWQGFLFKNLLAQCLGRLHVRGRRALGALLHVELHLLAFSQTLESAA